MPEETPDEGSAFVASVADTPIDAEAYNRFVQSASLSGITVVALNGERRASGDATQTRFHVEAGFKTEGDFILYRFDGVGRLTDQQETDYGEVSASVIVAVKVTEIPEPTFIEQFGATSAVMMAHPYLRETLASTALKMGFRGISLPMIVQGSRSEPQAAESDPAQ
jgi:hypothetical protein